MGVIFIIQVLRIYYGNEATFTREICGRFLLQMLPIIILWIVTVVASYIYFKIKKNPKKNFAKITYAAKLKNLEAMCPYVEEQYELNKKSKIDFLKISIIHLSIIGSFFIRFWVGLFIIFIVVIFFLIMKKNPYLILYKDIIEMKKYEEDCPIIKKSEFLDVLKEKRKREVAMIINIVVLCICAIMSLGYLLNVKHFDSSGDLTKQAIDMGIHLLPWVIIAFGSMIGTTIYEEISSKKSIELVKLVIKNNGKKEAVKYENKNTKTLNIIRGVLVGVALILIVVGIFDGGAADVLQKAINICTECIGLG